MLQTAKCTLEIIIQAHNRTFLEGGSQPGIVTQMLVTSTVSKHSMLMLGSLRLNWGNLG